MSHNVAFLKINSKLQQNWIEKQIKVTAKSNSKNEKNAFFISRPDDKQKYTNFYFGPKPGKIHRGKCVDGNGAEVSGTTIRFAVAQNRDDCLKKCIVFATAYACQYTRRGRCIGITSPSVESGAVSYTHLTLPTILLV